MAASTTGGFHASAGAVRAAALLAHAALRDRAAGLEAELVEIDRAITVMESLPAAGVIQRPRSVRPQPMASRGLSPVLRARIMAMAAIFERRGMHGVIDRDDLFQAASIALLRAEQTFDASRGVSWETYAMLRARGAMLDEARRVDHIPRLARSREKRGGRELPKMFSIDSFLLSPDADDRVGLPDSRIPIPSRAAELTDVWRWVSTVLGPRDMRAVRMRFEEGLNLKEIGRRLGVCESRSCQLMAASLGKLALRMSTESWRVQSKEAKEARG